VEIRTRGSITKFILILPHFLFGVQMPKRGKRKRRSKLKELLMLLCLKSEGPIGRYRLKDMLGLSEYEGVVKLMLSDFRKEGYVSTSKLGSKLTAKGEKLLAQRLKTYNIIDVKDFDLPDLKTGPVTVGIQIRGKADKIRFGIDERDAAVKAGAQGATVLTFKDGALRFPPILEDLSSKYPELAAKILETYGLIDGDIIIFVSAENRWRALEGALAAALSLH